MRRNDWVMLLRADEVTLQQAAQLHRVTVRYIQVWLSEGMPSRLVAGHRVIRKTDLQQWRSKHRGDSSDTRNLPGWLK